MRVINPETKNKRGGAMKQFLKRIRQGNRGFTLIELLIVIAILGVLIISI